VRLPERSLKFSPSAQRAVCAFPYFLTMGRKSGIHWAILGISWYAFPWILTIDVNRTKKRRISLLTGKKFLMASYTAMRRTFVRPAW
jgi:hypothetical protein